MQKGKNVLFTQEAVLISLISLCLLWVYSLDRTRLGHSIPDEKRYIQSTKEMAASGDYITPRYHGKLRFQKPILFYWLVILSYKFFGIGLYGARFPSIAAGILHVIVVYLLGRELFNKKAGLFAACVLSTCEVFFMYSRFATPDATFSLFITASLYVFVKTYRSNNRGRFAYLSMYCLMAFAMLTKGPLGFIYPVATICVFLTATNQWRRFKELNLLSGFILFLVISMPWFITMIYLHGNDYLAKVWSLEIVKKLKYFTSGQNENFLIHCGRSLSYYLGMLVARHLPWSPFLLAAFITAKKSLFRSEVKAAETAEEQAGDRGGMLFIMVWFLVVLFILVAIWSKESYYVLAFSGPLSLFLGWYFSLFEKELRLSTTLLFRLPFIAAISASFLAVPAWLIASFYIFEKPLFSPSLLMFVPPFLMLYAYRQGNALLRPVSFFIASLAFFSYFAGYIMPTIEKDATVDIAAAIKSEISTGDLIGVASSEVSYHRLNAHIPDYKVRRIDKRSYFDTAQVSDKKKKSKGDFINEFLATKDKRVFCVITKDDYYTYVSNERRAALVNLSSFYVWKKFDKQSRRYYLDLAGYFLIGKRDLFRKFLKEKVYLISNRDR